MQFFVFIFALIILTVISLVLSIAHGVRSFKGGIDVSWTTMGLIIVTSFFASLSACAIILKISDYIS